MNGMFIALLLRSTWIMRTLKVRVCATFAAIVNFQSLLVQSRVFARVGESPCSSPAFSSTGFQWSRVLYGPTHTHLPFLRFDVKHRLTGASTHD